jgi:hypothetical protein
VGFDTPSKQVYRLSFANYTTLEVSNGKAINGGDYLEEKGVSFGSEVQRKRVKFGLPVVQTS